MRPLAGITVITLEHAIAAALCKPENYLGQSGVMVDRVLSRINRR